MSGPTRKPDQNNPLTLDPEMSPQGAMFPRPNHALKSRSVFLSVTFIAIFLLRGVGPAAANPDSTASEPIPVSVRNNPLFANLPAQLQAMVNALGFHTLNRFCVVGYKIGDKDTYPLAYIFWPTQNKIIAWSSAATQTILLTGQSSDLTRDILPDGEITINYLHRSDLAAILKDCWKFGNNYIIKKTVAGWVPISMYQQFSSIHAQLQFLVDNTHTRRKNSFCVIGQRDGGFLAAYVYWKTQSKLYMWLPDKDDSVDPYALANSVVEVDLKHGLRNKGDANDDGSEMQRSYAISIIKSCQRYGQNFFILKSH